MAIKQKPSTPMPKINETTTVDDFAALDKMHLTLAIARELGWRIEPIVVKTVQVVEADKPRDMHEVPVRNFSQFEIFDPEGQRQARGIAEHEVAVFLPEWVDKTDAALTLPLEAERWQLNMSAGFPVAYIIDATGAEVGSGSGTRTAKALCVAWMNYRRNSHAV